MSVGVLRLQGVSPEEIECLSVLSASFLEVARVSSDRSRVSCGAGHALSRVLELRRAAMRPPPRSMSDVTSSARAFGAECCVESSGCRATCCVVLRTPGATEALGVALVCEDPRPEALRAASEALAQTVARAAAERGALGGAAQLAEVLGLPVVRDETIGDHARGVWCHRVEYDPYVDRLLQGDAPGFVVLRASGKLGRPGKLPGGVRAVLTGSFNPLHDGHRGMMRAAAETLGGEVVAEIGLHNADKASIWREEALTRAAQFAGSCGVVLMARAPLFVQKCRVYDKPVVFVVGQDTASRILESRYYGGEKQAVDALSEIRDRGCSFLVAGRVDAKTDKFTSFCSQCPRLPLPQFHGLFKDIPESVFRVDVSSTQLRKGTK